MCLAKVFRDDELEENVLMESVTFLKQESGAVTMTSLFGEEKTVAGRIRSVNFNGSIVIVNQE